MVTNHKPRRTDDGYECVGCGKTIHLVPFVNAPAQWVSIEENSPDCVVPNP